MASGAWALSDLISLMTTESDSIDMSDQNTAEQYTGGGDTA